MIYNVNNIENTTNFSVSNENYHSNSDEIKSSSALSKDVWTMPTNAKITIQPHSTKCSQTSEDAHLSALALTRLLQGSAEEVLAFLSAEQLIELGRNVRKLKRLASQSSSSSNIDQPNSKSKRKGINSPLTYVPVPRHSDRLQDAIFEPKGEFVSEPDTTNLWMMLNAVADHHQGLSSDEDPTLLRFTYSSRGTLQEYSIRTDIERISSSTLPEAFRIKNCVYPRAMGNRSQYTGNRYEYESSVNDIAWRLTWINLDVLAGKRGLIQRAVDSYRNRFNVSRSRRVVRQEKLLNGTLRRRSEICCSGSSLPNSISQGYHHQYYSQEHCPSITKNFSINPSHNWDTMAFSSINHEDITNHDENLNGHQHHSLNSEEFTLFDKDTAADEVNSFPIENGIIITDNLSLDGDVEASIDPIFLTNVYYYDANGRQLILKLRLDIDSISLFNEKDLSIQSLKDELGILLVKLNPKILPSMSSTLRSAIDAFKYKILTSNPSNFAPDIANRLLILSQRFGSLLAPLPSKQSITVYNSKSEEEKDAHEGLDLFDLKLD